jgi:hypothetical protein
LNLESLAKNFILLMLNLEVQVAGEPVVEERPLDVTGCVELQRQPWLA